MALLTLLAFIIGIVLLPFFGHPGDASAVAVHELNCKIDYDCSSGEFCFQSGRVSYCSTCVDCQHYNRESKGCARSRRDCGKCLPGFIELGAHCSPRVKEHVMGYQGEQNSKFHHGTHEKTNVLLFVCGLSVLIVTVVVVLPDQHGAEEANTREEANSQNLLVREGPNQFDPSVTVLREPHWDAIASSIHETDPVDSPQRPRIHANPSERYEDELVEPVSGKLASYEAGNDCNDGIEFALYGPASPSDPLASFIWDAFQRGSELRHTYGHDGMVNDLIEESMDFSAIVLDGEDEALMQIDANKGDDDAVDPRTSAS